MDEDRNRLREQSEKFAANNLRECANELLEMHSTTLLRNGKVRELAQLCAEWAGAHNALTIAERLVEIEALRAACKLERE